MLTNDTASVAFGLTSTFLYLGWAFFASQTQESHMGVALSFYAGANIALMWPTLMRVIG